MIAKALRMACLVVGALTAAVCDGVVDTQGPHFHDCSSWRNSSWSSLDLELDHSDSDACPLQYVPYDLVTAAASVVDNDAVYPNSDTQALVSKACSAYDINDYECVFELGDDTAFFGWDLEGTTWVRQVFTSIEYNADTTPDYAEHSVVLYSTVNEAIAVVQLEFCQETCDE